MRRSKKHPIPILSEDVERQIISSIAAYSNRSLWHKWGLDMIREQGVSILLHGDPGLGKTITAWHIGKLLRLTVREVSLADFGSNIPGQHARNIRRIFSQALLHAMAEHKPAPIILLDECDAMLLDRRRLGPDQVWMLEPINCLLAEMGKYPGLIILATNLEPILDPAVQRRLLASIRFTKPDAVTRVKIWRAKWPPKFPSRPNAQEYEELGRFELTGAEIENNFLLWAGDCMRQQITEPRVAELLEYLYRKHGADYNIRAAVRGAAVSAFAGEAVGRTDGSGAIS
jgi:SpoVK/Ycf46/Vps4 family AAA+-type ATPase